MRGFLFFILINFISIFVYAEDTRNPVVPIFRIGPQLTNNLSGSSGFGLSYNSLFISAGIRDYWWGFNPYLEYGTLKPDSRYIQLGGDFNFYVWFLSLKLGANYGKYYRGDSSLAPGYHAGGLVRIWNVERWFDISADFNYRVNISNQTKFYEGGIVLTFYLDKAPTRRAIFDNYAGIIDSFFLGTWNLLFERGNSGPKNFTFPDMPKLWPI